VRSSWNDDRYRVLVVGAGPSGSLTALNLHEKAEVTILEAKSSAGFPVRCAGLISKDCYNSLKNYCNAWKSKLNEIRGAFFFSPSGRYLEVRGKSEAVVVERKILDRLLLEEASKHAEVRMRTRFIECHGERVVMRNVDGTSTARYHFIIGSDGVESRVAKSLGYKRPDLFLAIQYTMEIEVIDERMVELYFGKRYSDGFFAYIVPIDEMMARVGVLSRETPLIYLKKLLEKHPSVSKRKKRSIIEVNFGAVPIGLVDFVKENTALVGDSAGMVKPYTGGGLYYLLRAAEILAKEFPNLQNFKKRYMKEMGKEYRAGEKIRRLYDILDDRDYDFLISLASNLDLSEVHMDRPSSAFKLIPAFLKMLKSFHIAKKVMRALI